MNRRAIVVALLASLAIAMLLWSKLQKAPGGQVSPPVVETPAEVKKPVVVSKKAVAARTRLEESVIKDSFEVKEIIASAVPALAISDIASMTGRYTAITILKGDIMTENRLMDANQIPNLARAVPRGKRAVSIAVSKVTSVGGFIQQGDFVDVIATFKPRGSEPVTKIVLQDIQVLAVGGSYQFAGGIPTMTPAISAAKVDLITLAVTPEELEKIIQLDDSTAFKFVLKNPNDKDKRVITKGATQRSVLQEIGHPDFVQVKAPSATTSESPQMVIAPVDDGKVEVMYGATKIREVYKYGGPAASKYQQLPDKIPNYVPGINSNSAEQNPSGSGE
ncbi:MAG: Flp pilus assembly protein CpaB [Candidatus Riflebacteria bacterium HGW-Riflebacteria-2]|jgi:pilus assembly protein CpaB|nr:MAG: Flp pilus assembly protein CpaB [Candidatus Riflebacteria bacterium HGW-Riflebacteria-2]